MAKFSLKTAMDKLLNREPEEEALPPLDEEVLEDSEAKDEFSEEPRAIAPQPYRKGKGLGVGFTNIDLTPPAFKEAVAVRELKKNWIFINAGVFALAFLVLSSIFVSSLPAKSELQSQEKSNSTLQTALGKYKGQTEALNSSGETQNKLNQAAGNAINWETLVSSIQNALPSGTSVSSIGMNISGSSDKGASLLLRFTADSPLGYADTLKAIQSARGVSNVQIGGMTSAGDNSYTFSATLDYDSTIKTNRFQAATGGN